MPTYAYRCSQCGHDFDEFQKITDAPGATCPQCLSQQVARQISGGSAVFQFKGSDFYCTDYKKSSPGQAGGGCCPCGKPPTPAKPSE